MARPISWLHRLHEIRKSVSDSVRSHYTRTELQALFQIQPRAASRILEMLETVAIGNTHVLAREDLGTFLDRMKAADDPHAELEAIRTEKAGRSRRKIRNLVRRDIAPATLAGVPENLTLEPGHVSVRFETVVELGETLLALALILESDGEEFTRRYEPQPAEVKDESAEEVRELFRELQEMEKEFVSIGGGP